MSAVFFVGEPPLSILHAHLLAGFFATAYVGSLYLAKQTRLSFSFKDGTARVNEDHRFAGERWRDDPDVIKARLTAASTATVLSCVVVGVVVSGLMHSPGPSKTAIVGEFDRDPDPLEKYMVVHSSSDILGLTIWTTLSRLGITHSNAWLPYLLTPTLFLGPIYGWYLQGRWPFQSNWSWKRSVLGSIDNWPGIRNYIVVRTFSHYAPFEFAHIRILQGPITEEIVFRACVISVYHLAGVSPTKMVFLTPLSFAIGASPPIVSHL
jgi:prenyl protein peptidase